MGLTGQNFNGWRPNDNSASTRIKYDLEAEHWLRSFTSAQNKASRSNRSIMADLATGLTVLSFFSSILSLMFLLLEGVLGWLFNLITGQRIEGTRRVYRYHDDRLYEYLDTHIFHDCVEDHLPKPRWRRLHDSNYKAKELEKWGTAEELREYMDKHPDNRTHNEIIEDLEAQRQRERDEKQRRIDQENGVEPEWYYVKRSWRNFWQ